MLSQLETNETMMTASMSRSMSSSPTNNENENTPSLANKTLASFSTAHSDSNRYNNNHDVSLGTKAMSSKKTSTKTASTTSNRSNIRKSSQNPTTTTTTTTIEVVPPQKPKKNYYVSNEGRAASMDKLHCNLLRYARCNDRRMAIRTIKDQNWLATFIPLSDTTTGGNTITTSSAELEQEIAHEIIVLNDIVLTPKHLARTTDRIGKAGTTHGGVSMLQMLTKTLCTPTKEHKTHSKTVTHPATPNAPTATEQRVYRRLLTRVAKSTASEGVSTQLQKLMGSPEIIVQQLIPDKHIVKGIVYNANENIITLNMYTTTSASSSVVGSGGGQKEEEEEVHLELNVSYDFGLFRKTDVSSKRPWIVLKCHVHERANLTTDESIRSFTIQAPNLY